MVTSVVSFVERFTSSTKPDVTFLSTVTRKGIPIKSASLNFTPGPGGKWQISTQGGREPAWARNGELFYRNGNQMMAVEITTDPTFSPGTPKVLFEGDFQMGTVTRAIYDVTPDGQRFVMVQEGGSDSAPTQINVVLNWFEELKQRVPTGN